MFFFFPSSITTLKRTSKISEANKNKHIPFQINNLSIFRTCDKFPYVIPPNGIKLYLHGCLPFRKGNYMSHKIDLSWVIWLVQPLSTILSSREDVSLGLVKVGFVALSFFLFSTIRLNVACVATIISKLFVGWIAGVLKKIYSYAKHSICLCL